MNKVNTSEKDKYICYCSKVSSDENKVLHVGKYNGLFLNASVMCEQIIGFQFHPEKSGNIGLSILNKVIRVLK